MTYEHLTDDEFLSVISSKPSLTQIESELIRRLQRDEYKRGYESGHEDGYQEAKEEFSEE